jgi:SAM-dependent methyltransferase
MSTQDDDARWACERQWFHAIDFGDLCTAGRFPATVPPNYTLFGFYELVQHIDLASACCIDVGTMDGLAAFVLKKLGAQRVIATDLAPRQTFAWARDRLGLDVDYRTPVQVLDLPTVLPAGERADLVVMAGVLYHVLDPIAAIAACRETLKADGLLILETMYDFGSAAATMSFNPLDASPAAVERANVFWRPSHSALVGMLQLVGFEVVASLAVDARVTFLARARRPSQLTGTARRIREIHRRYGRYANYKERLDLAAFERDDGPLAALRYRGPVGERWLFKSLYRPKVPLQPAWRSADWQAKLRAAALSAGIHATASLARLGGRGRLALSERLRGLG